MASSWLEFKLPSLSQVYKAQQLAVFSQPFLPLLSLCSDHIFSFSCVSFGRWRLNLEPCACWVSTLLLCHFFSKAHTCGRIVLWNSILNPTLLPALSTSFLVMFQELFNPSLQAAPSWMPSPVLLKLGCESESLGLSASTGLEQSLKGLFFPSCSWLMLFWPRDHTENHGLDHGAPIVILIPRLTS